MYLCIYKKGKKYYFNTVKKLTEKFSVTNQDMKSVNLGYKDKIESFALNSWEDFKKIKAHLKLNYGLRLFVAEIKAADKTFQKLIIELMKNPFYHLVLGEKEEKNEVTDKDNGNVHIIELFSFDDWKLAEQGFNFKSDFYKNIFTAEELPQ